MRLPILGFGIALLILTAFSGAIYHKIHYGIFKRTTVIGVNVYTHLSYFELSNPNSTEWNFVEKHLPLARQKYGTWNASVHEDIPWIVNSLPHDLLRSMGAKTSAAIQRDDALLKTRFIAWVWENPMEYLSTVRIEAIRLLWKCEEYYPTSLLNPILPMNSWARALERSFIHQPPFLLLLFGILGVGWARQGNQILFILLLGCGSYLALIASIQMGFTRYTLPVYPLLCLGAMSGMQVLFGKKKSVSKA